MPLFWLPTYMWIFAIVLSKLSLSSAWPPIVGEDDSVETTGTDFESGTTETYLDVEQQTVPKIHTWGNAPFETRIQSYIDYGRRWQTVVSNQSRFLEEVDEYLTRLPNNASKIVTTQSRDVCHCEGRMMMPCPLRCMYSCYIQNTNSYIINNGWRHEDDCRGMQMLDCKCHKYSSTSCYKDNLLNCINRTTEYVQADKSCSRYSVNKHDLVRSYGLILNLFMEPLKMYFRSVESRLKFLKQAAFTIDSLSSIAGLRCSDINDGICTSGIDQLLSEEETIYNQMKINFTLELFKIQSKIHTTSLKVDKLKQGTFDTINRSIKEYACCLKSLDFAVDEFDCSDVTNSYPTEPSVSECECDPLGSYGPSCNSEGSCTCRPQFVGKLCNRCKDGYYNHPLCAECGCDPRGSVAQTCNSEGLCSCKPGVEGKNCNMCKDGLYNYPECTELTTTEEPTTEMPNPRYLCMNYPYRKHRCYKRWSSNYGEIACSNLCDGRSDCDDGSDERNC